jgi:hypothetical protein
LRPAEPPKKGFTRKLALLLYEILDLSNHAALDSGIATNPLAIEILTDRFLAFVEPKQC